MGFGGHQETLRKHFSTPLDSVAEATSLPELRVYDLGLYRSQMRRKSEGITFFSSMNLSGGFLAPQLTDYLLSNAIERLLERGELVKLPRPKIGGSYSWIGGSPAPAEGFAIAYNENRSKARRARLKPNSRGCASNTTIGTWVMVAVKSDMRLTTQSRLMAITRVTTSRQS